MGGGAEEKVEGGRDRKGRGGREGGEDGSREETRILKRRKPRSPYIQKSEEAPCENRRSFRHYETRTNRSTNKRKRMTHNSAESSGFPGFQVRFALGRPSKRMSGLGDGWAPIPVQRVIDNDASAVRIRKWKREEKFEAGPRFVFCASVSK